MARVLSGVIALVVAACLAGTSLLSQQQFTTTTSLLTLDVSVLDLDGNPVTGLDPDDFVVTLNDETKAVRTMVFLATQRRGTTDPVLVRSPGSPTTPSLAAASAANHEPDPKLLVILIDDMSIHPTDSKGLFVAAERFVDTIPDRDWVGLTSTSGRMTVNPSPDRAPLMKELKQTFGWMNDPRRDTGPFVGFMDALEAEASGAALLELIRTSCGSSNSVNSTQLLTANACGQQIDRKVRDHAAIARISTRSQLDNYAAVIRAMASAPGVKQLVILTGGVALRPSDSREFIPVAAAAVAAGVQITMLMEDPDPDMRVENPGAWLKDQQRMLQQVQTLAEMSGGQFFRVVGQADRFYQRVLTSASAIYRLGVDVPKGVPPDGNYKLAVTVNRPGVKVLASRYAVPPIPTTAGTAEEQMKHAISTGAPLYGVPVQMLADVVQADGSSATAIRVAVDVPGDTPGPVSGIFGIVGPDQQLKSGRREFVRSSDGKTYHLDILVPASSGTYVLRFAAADASGAVGAVSETVVVKALSIPLPASAVQHRDASALLERASTYLESYEKAFSAVVSEESYSQELRIAPRAITHQLSTPPQWLARTLRADVLQAHVGQREWVAFRDVYEVDGRSVRDRDARLQALFIKAPAGAFDQARRILAESARYNLGRLQRDINVPTMALTYLREPNQPRSVFTIARDQDIGSVTGVVLEFKERATPTIVRSADGDLPATGRVWIEPESGRVLKTEISIAGRRSGAKVTVTYGAVPELKMWVPILMTEEYTGAETILTKASYSNFRQFAVSVGIK